MEYALTEIRRIVLTTMSLLQWRDRDYFLRELHKFIEEQEANIYNH
jgi:hypothetical protein